MFSKLWCQADNQNCTFQFGRLWWSALPRNYAAWINLPWKTSGKVEWCYLISTDATRGEHQTGPSEWVRQRLRNHLRGVGDGWHACLRGLSVLLTTRFISDRHLQTPSTTFWVHSPVSFFFKISEFKMALKLVIFKGIVFFPFYPLT